MTFINALKATDRSLKLAVIRAAVRVGSWLAPARTSEFVARRFFATDKPPPHRTQFAVGEPVRGLLHTPDGEVVTYRWGHVDRDPTVVLVHGWNGWAHPSSRAGNRLVRSSTRGLPSSSCAPASGWSTRGATRCSSGSGCATTTRSRASRCGRSRREAK